MILIGLGGNLPSDAGPPATTIETALTQFRLYGIIVVARSSFYESEPVPRSEQPWFVNAVVRVETALGPDELLARLHAIEHAFGRIRRERNEREREYDKKKKLSGSELERAEYLKYQSKRFENWARDFYRDFPKVLDELWSPTMANTLDMNAVAQSVQKLEQMLAQDKVIENLAEGFSDKHHALFLGRGDQYPIAMEGALKLKEISYIHAEGYPAGEMKHGPIALIDEDLPVVALAPDDAVFEKMIGNIQEAKARGGSIIVVTNQSKAAAFGDVLGPNDVVLTVPDVDPLLNPVLMVVPLQLIAYHIAVRRGCDVDQPRNLAKSVTVE